MSKQYVVTDEEGNISWSNKTEAAESFETFAAAEKRARALAQFAPGQPIRLYKMAAEVIVPVLPVKTTRRP